LGVENRSWLSQKHGTAPRFFVSKTVAKMIVNAPQPPRRKLHWEKA
jgi:hypothetical protein